MLAPAVFLLAAVLLVLTWAVMDPQALRAAFDADGHSFFETLTLRQLGRHHKPMALLSTLDYYAPFEALLRHTAREGFMSEAVLSLFAVCRTPEEALAHVTAPVEPPDAAPSLAAYSR